MPTRRAWTLFFLALILYFLANQTQVGWIYILSNGLLGLLIVAFFYSQGMLNRIETQRAFAAGMAPEVEPTQPNPNNPSLPELPAFHEDDPIQISLHFAHTGWRPALQVSGDETCPLAPAGEQAQPFF